MKGPPTNAPNPAACSTVSSPELRCKAASTDSIRPSLTFDAHQGLALFFADRHALAFMQNGGTVAYGMVPTLPQFDAIDSVALFTRWLKAASVAGDPQEFAQRAMITATCGLGLLNPSSVAESFNVAQAVGKSIRRLAGRPSAR